MFSAVTILLILHYETFPVKIRGVEPHGRGELGPSHMGSCYKRSQNIESGG